MGTGFARRYELLLVVQFPNPDVPEQYRVAVILQLDGAFVSVRHVIGYGMGTEPSRAAGKFGVVLDEHAGMEHGKGRAPDHVAVFE